MSQADPDFDPQVILTVILNLVDEFHALEGPERWCAPLQLFKIADATDLTVTTVKNGGKIPSYEVIESGLEQLYSLGYLKRSRYFIGYTTDVPFNEKKVIWQSTYQKMTVLERMAAI